MSDRLSYLLVVILFLFAAVWRMASVTSLPPGLHPDEITEIRLIETARAGRIEVYYSVDGVGHEGLPATLIAAVSSLLGVGVTGYRIAAIFAGMLSVALLYAVVLRRFTAWQVTSEDEQRDSDRRLGRSPARHCFWERLLGVDQGWTIAIPRCGLLFILRTRWGCWQILQVQLALMELILPMLMLRRHQIQRRLIHLRYS